MCQREYAQKTFSGWLPAHPRRHNTGASAWAWHGDDGWLGHAPIFSYTDANKIDGYGPGDTVGLAVDFEKQTIFFTRNGKRLSMLSLYHITANTRADLVQWKKRSVESLDVYIACWVRRKRFPLKPTSQMVILSGRRGTI